MELHVEDDPEGAARSAAAWIARRLRRRRLGGRPVKLDAGTVGRVPRAGTTVVPDGAAAGALAGAR